jgi:Domain of unknown function (DUF6378)
MTHGNINDTLNERAKTHGDFQENGRIMQMLKDASKTGKNWPHLSDDKKEAIEMILHKIGRILSGNPNEPDHWKDIAGYATLVENILTKGVSHLETLTKFDAECTKLANEISSIPFKV